ncbi:MGH1-like glycoside hydrolase domain-containing protein [Polyangium aurulentum]|uniref:MGH1-like glycoside hydrolase domain-containing protein n=1 Tax=Polyangium aurulentum TaxID=2567896 RepID=UPI0010AE7DEA|nr:glucosidase [Polyangium aurulentum]UQA61115.1 glucosidase [Polyangium aurulentum]
MPSSRTEEHHRLVQERERVVRWKHWGPYLAERAWGTVREDYSAGGDAWNHFPHDHARSRAYRWNEDGLAGICDRDQILCLSLALWNGEDPILKERLFGLSGPEGNHGEDVKEVYYYEDATPTYSYLRYLYKYPHRRFPYEELIAGGRARGADEPELELWDLGVFDENRYFDVTVEYAKRAQNDILMVITVENRGPEDRTIHVLPHLWYRNTWSWDEVVVGPPEIHPGPRGPGHVSLRAVHRELGAMHLYVEGEDTELLFTNNESNNERLFGTRSRTPYVKDGFHARVVDGDTSRVNPEQRGSKAAAWRILNVPAGGRAQVRARLCADHDGTPFGETEGLLEKRKAEADEFYAHVQGPTMSPERRAIQRQAAAGMLWSMQYYNYDVDTWLRGDALPPPATRLRGRNWDWRHLSVADIISMPDKWEYPWFAAWDTAFHALSMASVDIEFAKSQLKLMVKEWYQHPSGQIPAYEWEFGDLNPPVHAWAAYQIYKIERKQRGVGDKLFLERMFHKLLINFAWWVNKRDVEGNNVFEGGFLGLDNISVFDRSEPPPPGMKLEQADATAWMAMYCIDLMRIALELAMDNSAYEDLANKFFEHFLRIAYTFHHADPPEIPLWDEDAGFYFDILTEGNRPRHLPVRSMVGLVPLFAVHVIGPEVYRKLDNFRRRMEWFLGKYPHLAESLVKRPDGRYVLTAVPPGKLERVLGHLFSEDEFLSPHGPRSLSKEHARRPLVLVRDGRRMEIGYEPGESLSRMKGGNSNWRGPVWFPTGYMLYRSILRLEHGFGDILRVPATKTHGPRSLREAADEIAARLVSIFERGPDGRRPVHGRKDLFQYDPHFRDNLLFYEYFHGDSGEGLGASHQTGWTGLVGDLVLRLERRRRDTDL